MITVLMPLFNGESFVRQSVESILGQSYRNFELLIIDDGSDDAGPEIVKTLPDERINYLQNSHNMGVAATLNRGLDIAQGRYIVRMDADDISLPDRLERQIKYMDSHPEVGISGGWARFFGVGLPYTLRLPCKPEALKCYSLFENPFCHMTVIMRRAMMQKHKLRYNGLYSRSEDYELWSRALRYFSLANIDRILVRARQHPRSATLSNWQEMTLQTEKVQAGLLSSLGITTNPEEQKFHHQIGRGYRQHEMSKLREGELWLLHLCQQNQKVGFADASAFTAVVGAVWLRFCTNSAPLGPVVWKCWRDSYLKSNYTAPLVDQLRLVASIVWHLIRPRRFPEHLSVGETLRNKERLR